MYSCTVFSFAAAWFHKVMIKDKLSLSVHMKSSVLIFLLKKMRKAFALQNLLVFFVSKNCRISAYKLFEMVTSH